MKPKTSVPPPPADTKMTPKEKEALIDQVASSEGPDPHEKHGAEPPKEEHEPGVARS